MAISDHAALTLASLVLTYLMLRTSDSYTKRVIADLIFLAIGYATYSYISTDFAWGIIIMFLAIIDGVFNALKLATNDESGG